MVILSSRPPPPLPNPPPSFLKPNQNDNSHVSKTNYDRDIYNIIKIMSYEIHKQS